MATDTLKRKHVVFDDELVAGSSSTASYPGPEVGAASGTAGAAIHPDRLARVGAANGAASKKPKVKSDKKKRYLAKKARRQRTLRSARKAAAPKHREWQSGDEGESGDEESDSGDSEGDGSDDEHVKPSAAAVAGPSTAPITAAAAAVPAATPVIALSEEEERARRKREKQEKRDARRDARQAARKAERQARKGKGKESEKEKDGVPRSTAPEEDNRHDGDGDEDDEMMGGAESEDGDVEDDADVDVEHESSNDLVPDSVPDMPEKRSRTPSPMLEPFPLPRAAPAPDPAVLLRQGLPTGLEDAVFIDQELRMGVVGDDVVLSDRTRKRLSELGVEDFFAVQAAMLPHLLSLPLTPLPHTVLNDYLVSAPTGSGKTLAYAIPIVELLAHRVVPRLRALIVLPTRDLVTQVRETLDALAKGTGLVIGSISGQHSFAHEQAQLVGDSDDVLLGGSSKLDILIATPGRLMDHLASTKNFSLQHLRFLVIDEADRLLTQSFQNWLAQVLTHTRPPSASAVSQSARPYDAVAPSWAEPLGLASGDWEGSESVPSTCQKLLFSATLTRDPAKVAALDLVSPRYFIVQSATQQQHALNVTSIGSSFALPSELVERMLILPPALKPLNLIHLIHAPQFDATPALVFTKSVDAASRLVKLLQFFEDAYVGAARRVVVRGYTRDMAVAERKRLLKDFTDGAVHISIDNSLVCSDLVARGMDLPAVAHVVSYDVPLDMTKYVHRAGRTARAGRAGTAWTLVEKQEALHFKGMLKGAEHEKAIRKIKVKEDDLAPYRESYEIAMKRLREEYGRE